MTETQKDILKVIEKFLNENPEQRFGQALFNLNINEFKKDSNEVRDIYNDVDKEILKRVIARSKQLKNK